MTVLDGGNVQARTSASLRTLQRSGRPAGGRPPYGWSRSKAGELEPIHAELAAVDRALELAELGGEPASIARQLELEGHPPRGARRHRSTVSLDGWSSRASASWEARYFRMIGPLLTRPRTPHLVALHITMRPKTYILGLLDHCGTPQTPTSSYPSGASPSIYQGMHSWVAPGHVLGLVVSQKGVQQPAA